MFLFLLLYLAFRFKLLPRPAPYFGRKKPSSVLYTRFFTYRRKPEWVHREVLRMKAFMPNAGCRQIADSFNRRFCIAKNMTVSKSFVHTLIQKHRYEIEVLRREMKHRIPKPIPRNRVWAMDLTGKTDSKGKLHYILGIVEHASRASFTLNALKNKSSITLMRALLNAIEAYGKPRFLRTDNEAVFTSRVFTLGLWLLGVRHQRIEKGCPWMNGRVERFFGTLKSKLNHWEVDNLAQLNGALGEFRFWYNHVRPHRHLGGRTPTEVWQGRQIYLQGPREEHEFSAWDGLLSGYYLRL